MFLKYWSFWIVVGLDLSITSFPKKKTVTMKNNPKIDVTIPPNYVWKTDFYSKLSETGSPNLSIFLITAQIIFVSIYIVLYDKLKYK